MQRIDVLLRETGVEGLNELTPAADIGRAVKALASHVGRLDPFAREVVCREAAERMRGNKIRGARRLVDLACKSVAPAEGAALQGSPVLFDEPDPWPEPVEGAELLDELVTTIRGHAFMSAEDAVAVALWIVHAHALDAARCTPRLAFLSPAKRCGKTTALRLVRALVPRALPAALPSAAVVFRLIEADRPTLLIDEADALARDNDDLRGVLNEGHMRNGVVPRCVGEDHQPRAFRVFAAVAIAAIGRLWDTLLDRSIIVNMRRVVRGEPIRRLRQRDLDALLPLRRRCARWAADNGDALKDAEPATPEALNDRAADNWEPLLAIADTAGGAWPARARAAATALSGGAMEDRDAEAPGIQLLADVRDALVGPLRGDDRVSMRQLTRALNGMEDRPWATVQYGQPLDANGLGRRLRPFGIRAVPIRTRGGVVKGYHLDAFADAFVRYLGATAVTSVTGTDSQAKAADSGGLRTAHVTRARTGQTRSHSARVTEVTGCAPELVEEEHARQERAAIYEFDGGLPREEAERRAGLH